MNLSTNSSSDQWQAAHSGFTLIELLVTIAVLAIIASMATPTISSQIANQRNRVTAATLENALKEAKAESMIRRQTLTLTYNNNGANAGTIVIAQGADELVSYSYNAKSTLKDSDSKTTITFQPSRSVDPLTYTICDATVNTTPRQVSITRAVHISSQTGGTCP